MLLLFPAATPLAAAERLGEAREFLEKKYARLTSAIAGPSSPAAKKRAADLIATAFDIDYFCFRITPESWPRMPPALRERLRGAVAFALEEEIRTFIGEPAGQGLPQLRFVSTVTAGRLPSGDDVSVYLERQNDLSWKIRGAGSGTVDYRLLRYELEGDREKKPLVFAVGRYPGGWQVTDVFSRSIGLAGVLREKGRPILQKYSLAYLIAEFSQSDVVILEDWSAGPEGALPPEWRWKKKDNGRRVPYRIREESGERYLAADDSGESVVIGKEVRWNLEKYPYLLFRWRARTLPDGGDERRGETNDSAAGVSLLYDLRLGVIPRTVKFVWSTTIDVGSAVRREGLGRPWVVVADSGDRHLGSWRTHVFNADEAYRKTFGASPPTDVVGIGILTDANATSSAAAADYGIIAAMKRPDAWTSVTDDRPVKNSGGILIQERVE